MIRPSAQEMASRCSLAPHLAEKFPEATDHANVGSQVDDEITRALRGEHSPSMVAELCARYIRERFGKPAREWIQERVTLRAPETDEELSSGTPDYQCLVDTVIHTVDWKRIHQWRLGRLPHPTINKQLTCYSVARGLEVTATAHQNTIVLFDEEEGTIEPVDGEQQPESSWWSTIAQIERLNATEPAATPGPHCGECYQRFVCPSYRERAITALALLPASNELALTHETAPLLVQRIKAVRDACAVAEDIAKAYVLGGGRIEDGGKTWAAYPVAGRRSGPSVSDCEKAGLDHMIKPGRPSERWEWRNAK